MSVEKLMGAIKQASMGAVEAGAPVSVRIGTVKSVSPLSVTVDQRFTLTAEFLILTAATERLAVTVEGTEYPVRPGLQAGDKVVLLRVQGGQQYVILDKVVQG
ncbi:DUF2577 domain-containing protein [Cohnella caldifontis]|uniref:DUF2577 domain-containing protein n=1 Tax=Cohnella caldifontis TaxID=3027471 RepID=UPI0023EA8809|nr:DUF2577 domain-containing protein [Cohnella sp. YIM B05605]